MLTIIFISILMGAVVGLLAGLLGIGGGLIVVPILVILLPAYGIVAPEHAMLVAIATSLGSIMITATSSIRAHHKWGNIPWPLASRIMLGASIGAWCVGYLAHLVDGVWLQRIFAVAVTLIALRMLGSRSVIGKRALPGNAVVVWVSGVLGGLASLLGIGGGALFVPVLNYYSVDMKRAIGCAAASGVAIAVFGTLGYVIAGWQSYQLSDGFLGFIYLPAMFGIIVTSVFTAPIGARLTQQLPVLKIKRFFGVFLMAVALRMFFA
ncbi:sulfite exporter TauE/SafE family protein [Alkalimonas collagenimarina]|uniref:Probable membrane transporter protein n=1 Tax=Alkalimonas collagenimarina TaxID=400390 RepID=A0ABT9GXQ7_9GAMM|nr:sulfite exporter TauE/SafE family protein [Alkalimonas collagenimarina]MDP4535849.1 sulfite exporter TauE/SafE family protein [Alkalimonas collagenimarina]